MDRSPEVPSPPSPVSGSSGSPARPVPANDPAVETACAGAEDTHAPGAAADSAPSRRAPAAPAAGESVVGRYRLLRELGRGSMGAVYLARDPELQRDVALKLLLPSAAGDAEHVERFLREAKAVATLAHPHVVALFDVGRSGDLHYLTMEALPGGSVAQLAARDGRLPPAEALRLVAEAAEGVGHAHLHGIVHRDLKPANLLLDAAGRVKVSDFGLARQVGDAASIRLTRSGQILGTPAYMAPEQAEGSADDVGAASDVYALGSILYELVTGRVPYPGGAAMEVLFRKVALEPPAPRAVRPELHRDVETIVLKAMEREPGRRYAGAGELADDIRRYLAGEGIRARPATGWERALRRVRRNRGLAAGLAAAGAALLVGGVIAAREAAERAEAQHAAAESRAAADRAHALAEERRRALLTQVRNVAELALAGTLELRRHGVVARADTFVRALERAYGEATRDAPELAEPHFHLGRMRRAQLLWNEALALQDQALAREPGYVPSLYERAILCARGYQVDLLRARTEELALRGSRVAGQNRVEEGAVAVAEPAAGELEARDATLRRWREESLEAARRLEAAVARDSSWREHPVALLRVGDAKLACARGLRMLLEPGDPAAARALLEEAVRGDATLEEAHETLWREAYRAGRWEDAVAIAGRGLEADRGYVPLWLDRAIARVAIGQRPSASRPAPAVAFAAALADFDRALELDPGNGEAWMDRGVAVLAWASARRRRGERADDLYERAVADLGRAIERAPGLATAWLHRSSARQSWALHRSERGEDPEELYRAAIQDFTARLAGGDAPAQAWRLRASAWSNWGTWKKNRGRDADEEMLAGSRDAERAVELDPRSADNWAVLGSTCAAWAVARIALRRDPEDRFERGLRALDRAIELDPTEAEFLVDRGMSHSNRGLWRLGQGQDPDADFAAAAVDLQRALEIRPGHPQAPAVLAGVWGNRALYLSGRGRDATEAFANAIAKYDCAAESAPLRADLWMGRGGMLINLAFHQQARGESGEDALAEAERDLGRALERNPGFTSAWYHRGVARTLRAREIEARGEPAAALYGEAAGDFEQVVKANPTHPDAGKWLQGARTRATSPPRPRWEALLVIGDAHADFGRWSAARSRYEEALRQLDEAGPAAAAGRDAAALDGWIRATHYSLACILAHASEGRGGPDHEPRPVSPAESADLRGRAMEHLRAALAKGGVDLAQVAADHGLRPLHAEAGWAELVAGAGK